MKLSVVIVNYNVEYFLEQCLHSVRLRSKCLQLVPIRFLVRRSSWWRQNILD